MKQFHNVVIELKNWLTPIPWINTIAPLALYLLFGGLTLVFLHELMVFLTHRLFPFISSISAIGHFAFLLGFWITLISPEVKWVPYALFINAFIILFPFTSFSLYSIINAAINLYFGYQLLRYTAYASNETK